MQKFSFCFLLILFSHGLYSQQLLFTEPKLLPVAINGESDVDFPMFAPDGTKLFFSRSGSEQNAGGKEAGGDIWFTSLDTDGNWKQAINAIEGLNNDQENAVVGINESATRIYLYNSYLKANPSRISICYSDWINGAWSSPKLLNIGTIEVGLNPYGLFMNTKEDVLLLSVTGLEGQGEEDIYVSFKKDGGKWSKPLNLGPVVNTKGYDFSPFLDHTGKNLYFASNGHGGFGGTDILVSTRLDDTWTSWSTPINLGSKINSPQDEIYFTMTNRDLAFFSSKRNSERSAFYESSIQLMEKEEVEQKSLPVEKLSQLTEKPLTLISRISSKSSMTAMPEVSVMVVDEDGTVLEKKKTGPDGTVFFTNLKSDRNYRIMLDTNVSELNIMQIIQEKVVADPQIVYAMYDAGAWITSPSNSPYMELISRVVYKASSKEAEARLVILMAEDGTELARAYTDEQGLVIFRKLPTDRKYKLKTEETELNLSYVIVKDTGMVLAQKAIETPVETPKAKSAPENPQPVSLIKLTPSSSGSGRNELNLLLRVSPKDGKALPSSIGLVIENDKGVIVYRGKTDQEGYVRFDKLNADKGYHIRLENESDLYQLGIAESYDDSKLQRLSISSQQAKGQYLGCINQKLVKERGQYKLICRLKPTLNQEPMANIPLVLVDDSGLIVSKAKSDSKGEVVFRSLFPDKMYRLVSERPLPNTDIQTLYQFDLNEAALMDTSTMRPRIGTSFTANVLFNYDRYDIEEQLNGPLLKLMDEMVKSYPTVKLTLVGHADQAGEESYNLQLSRKRAEALKTFLTRKYRLRPDAIQIDAKGESLPLMASAEEVNRRVELLVQGY
jgi:outer membrane protein OmpA-like peptidoglycan-associated protein